MNQWWNFNHLRLFYHVAAHRGISAALPHIGYSLQQPALSGQMLELERQLGRKLFVRQPFALTEVGERLYSSMRPLFEQLVPLLNDIARGNDAKLRVGAVDSIVTLYLGEIARCVARSGHPKGVEFLTADPRSLLGSLRAGELDCVITTAHAAPPGVHSRRLLQVPLALLVHSSSRARRVEKLLGHGTLICPIGDEAVCHQFDAGLKAACIPWRPTVRVQSVTQVVSFVAADLGVGMGLAIPSMLSGLPVRALPLEGFGSVTVLAAWRENPPPKLLSYLGQIEQRALEGIGGRGAEESA